jgi:hypothetical protein
MSTTTETTRTDAALHYLTNPASPAAARRAANTFGVDLPALPATVAAWAADNEPDGALPAQERAQPPTPGETNAWRFSFYASFPNSDPEPTVERIHAAAALAIQHGAPGATVTFAHGSWTDDNGRTVYDVGVRVEIILPDDQDPAGFFDPAEYAETLRLEWFQDSVLRTTERTWTEEAHA